MAHQPERDDAESQIGSQKFWQVTDIVHFEHPYATQRDDWKWLDRTSEAIPQRKK